MTLNLLVVICETPDQQASRRKRSGRASHETLADALRAERPDLTFKTASCVDGTEPDLAALELYDGVAFGGSPISMYEDNAETRSAARFMRAVFESGTPSFGSCAGLQIAAVAAGGEVTPRDTGMRAAITRGITRTEAGRGHPLLAGRPEAWDVPAMHSSIVTKLPPGGTALAHTEGTPVEAMEVRHGEGVHWGVQYHPEVGLAEIADAIGAQASELVDEGLAEAESDVKHYAKRLTALGNDPGRHDLAWQLGIGREAIEPDRRRREIANFLARLAG